MHCQSVKPTCHEFFRRFPITITVLTSRRHCKSKHIVTKHTHKKIAINPLHSTPLTVFSPSLAPSTLYVPCSLYNNNNNKKRSATEGLANYRRNEMGGLSGVSRCASVSLLLPPALLYCWASCASMQILFEWNIRVPRVKIPVDPTAAASPVDIHFATRLFITLPRACCRNIVQGETTVSAYINRMNNYNARGSRR